MTSTSWVVIMTFATEFPVEEKQLDALSDRFDELDWSVAVDPDGALSVTAYLDDDEHLMSEAFPMVVDVARAALAQIGLASDMVKVEAMTEDRREQEAVTPQLPELVAATDVAKLLDVSRQRVNQLHHDHQDFPEPVVHTGGGSLWTRYAIDRFVAAWDRRPGYRSVPAVNASVVELRARPIRGRSSQKEGTAPVIETGRLKA